jgi:hypothetical protein
MDSKQFTIAIIALLFSGAAYCQSHEHDRLVDVLDEYALNKRLKYEPSKTEGSPYSNKMFAPAAVSGLSQKVMMRYDTFADEFEFVNSTRDTLVLNKLDNYNTITFSNTNMKYQLVDYFTNGKVTKGYLIWLYAKNNFTLYKKQNIVYNKERIAKSGFDKTTPANFEKAKNSYYVRDGEKAILEFPTNKKTLLKAYPERKTDIETFIKQNNIDLEKESDIIKVVDFLAV